MRHVAAIIAGTLGLSLLICLGMTAFLTIEQAMYRWEVTCGQ